MNLENYRKECLAELKADKGFILSVTPEQAEVILIPRHAPENFYHDGEIEHEEAVEIYIKQLNNVGFNPTYVNVILRYMRL